MRFCPAWLRPLHPLNTKPGCAACSNWSPPVSFRIAVGDLPPLGKFGGTAASLPGARLLPRRAENPTHAILPISSKKKRVALDCQSAFAVRHAVPGRIGNPPQDAI